MWKQEEGDQARCQQTEQDRQEDILFTVNDSTGQRWRVRHQTLNGGGEGEAQRTQNHSLGKKEECRRRLLIHFNTVYSEKRNRSFYFLRLLSQDTLLPRFLPIPSFHLTLNKFLDSHFFPQTVTETGTVHLSKSTKGNGGKGALAARVQCRGRLLV